ncbi:MAG TPA: IclR family transcriptional regulator [Casimicrobiaceae bacterium]|jgi:DNA-binding IclR family transcriptional regulator|nr:IclR family transcriptional regulator [Casimicrobiaceae bacterium]
MAHVPAERCLAIIELLAEDAETHPLGEIAEALDLPKSGAHRLLTTLCELGWAEQDPETSFYRLTMRLATLGQKFYAATGIPDICQPLLDTLARESREFARLAVVDGHSLVWVAHAQGAQSGLVYQPSLATNTVPLAVTASGKAWLATFADDRALEYVRANGGFDHADRYGPNATRSASAFLRELAATARRGYGLAMSEAEPGVTAIAAAIRVGAGGHALGTVSVAGPSVRMTDARVAALAPLVVRCASKLAELWHLRRLGRPGEPSAAAPASTAEAALGTGVTSP